jgi:WD40 repeat protein
MIKNLLKHKTSVNSLCAIKNDLIVSGSLDGMIKVWKISSTACVQTIENNENQKNSFLDGISLDVNDEIGLVGGFLNGSIKVWKSINENKSI